MKQLSKDDLAQMNRDYFQSLELERLVEVTVNLHKLAVEQYERLEQKSHNSSRPPSSDNPYTKKPGQDLFLEDEPSAEEEKTRDKELDVFGDESSQESEAQPPQEAEHDGTASQSSRQNKRTVGKQPGAPGKWRSAPLLSEETIAHFPETCAACNGELTPDLALKPYLGYYTLELEQGVSGFRIKCNLHHYYENRCACGHQTKACPGQGYVSTVEGRKRNLQLQEYTLVGPLLTTLIASLSVRHRMSRPKIREFLIDWANTPLSTGTIDRCIREAGIACLPVVEELVEQLQDAQILHLDETPWYETAIVNSKFYEVSAAIRGFGSSNINWSKCSQLSKSKYLVKV